MPQSVYHLLNTTTKQHGSKPAALFKQDGKWIHLSWQQFNARILDTAAALLALSVKPKDRIAIFSDTRLEWALADVATLSIAAETVPIYSTNSIDDIRYILDDCSAQIVFVENAILLQRLRQASEGRDALKLVICFDASAALQGQAEVSFADFVKAGQGEKRAWEIEERASQIAPKDIATIVYTSGTTGQPKGAMLTHANLVGMAKIIEETRALTQSDLELLFLPLAHIFARVLMLGWIRIAHVMAFAESVEKLIDNMAEVKPTMMAGVPRVFEKVYGRAIAAATSAGGIKSAIAKWAIFEAHASAKRQSRGKRPTLLLGIAKALVLKKIGRTLHERFGGRVRFLLSGGAPLSPEIAFFFHYAGIMALEGYGLTETSAATTLNIPHSFRIGTVGRAVPHTQVKIAKDGEVLIKGIGVFKGYLNKPDETKEAFDEEGWFKSGDVGELDASGFLRITDRKKDLIVTAIGKKIAPQKVENLLKSMNPLIAQVIVYGDKRPYISAVITLEDAQLETFAKAHGLTTDKTQLVKNALLVANIQNSVDTVNARLAKYEQIKKFTLVPDTLKVGIELTPTLKLKRPMCFQKFRKEFDAMYSTP
jgi:long-chain acyl-CoA synthetase